MNDYISNLNFLSSIMQLMSFQILVSDFNNTDLMKYLEHQDMLLNKIIDQNEKIINLLGENNGREYQENSK